jgi:hypothetical protein
MQTVLISTTVKSYTAILAAACARSLRKMQPKKEAFPLLNYTVT